MDLHRFSIFSSMVFYLINYITEMVALAGVEPSVTRLRAVYLDRLTTEPYR